MEEYLTTAQLSARIKMAQGTIRNLIWKEVLIEHTHFIKPTPRKLLFKWSAIEKWLNRIPADVLPNTNFGINSRIHV